jgi:hypothetical protein
MADTTAPISPADADLAAADRQAEVMAERARVDPKLSEKPNVDASRESDLDNSLAEVMANTSEDGSGPRPDTEPKPEAEPKPDAEPKKVEASSETKPEASTKPKGALDDLLSDAKADATKSDHASDPAEEIKLRSDASPKTRETFEQLKTVYKAKLDANAARIAELEAKHTELEQKASATAVDPLTPELKQELESLRSFRVQFDTENDPSFRQKYDSRVGANYSDIYAKLAEHQLPETEIAKLKAMPAVERDTVIDSFFDRLPAASRRFIEAKLVDNENVNSQRAKELFETRAKADTILAERAKAPEISQQKRIEEIGNIIRPLLPNLDFIHTKDIPASAGAEERKVLEERNTFAAHAQQLMRTAILDDSPRSRADAAVALPLAHHFKRQLDATTAKLAAVTAELEGIRKAGRTSRTAQTSARPGTGSATSAKAPENSGDAVDQLFAEVSASEPSTRN